MPAYCCTCAAPLADCPAAAARPRRLPCCDRVVCGPCLQANARFATYCPYCQIATAPPPAATATKTAPARDPSRDLLPPGLKPPPPYRRRRASRDPANDGDGDDEAPPPYASVAGPPDARPHADTKQGDDDDDDNVPPVLHYLDHDRDSVVSLALRYRVSADQLRRANRLTADHLLLGRRVLVIPAAAGPSASPSPSSSSSSPPVSLSPRPVEGEAEARRKAAIRRFMVACKVADYDVAVLYLEQTAAAAAAAADDDDDGPVYDLAAAVAAFQADDRWERAHPVEAAAARPRRDTDEDKTKASTAAGFWARLRGS